jgi:MazG family protein
MRLTRRGGAGRAPADNAGATASAASPPPRDEHGLREGLAGLRDLVDRLLAEDGCPWDRAQTLETLRPYLLEEAHEVLEAMHDPDAHRTELGDLLFQIVLQAALREREGRFDLDAVIEGIKAKMIRRHPHVFGDERERGLTPDEVMRRWEAIKQEERGAGPRDPLRGVPRGLPALQRAWRLQQKAASVGFDWPTVDGALDKVDEELGELRAAVATGDPAEITEELGDLLFVLVRVGQKLGVEAEEALRQANAKFERRFAAVMAACHAQGIDPAAAGLEQLDALWDAAKRAARSAPR